MNIFGSGIHFFFYFIKWWVPVQSNGIITLLKSDMGQFCLTNSSLPMIYTLGMGADREASKIIPESQYSCSFEKHETCYKDFDGATGWERVSSLRHENLPIFDVRWENLERQLLNRTKKSTNDELNFIKLMDLESPDFNITLSVRATEVHFYFCDKIDVREASCYWFILQGWEGKYTILRKCKSKEIPVFHKKYPQDGCKIPLQNITHAVPYLQADIWGHIMFRKYGRHFALDIFDHSEAKNILHYEDVKEDEIEIRYMLGNANSIAYYKIHEYNYLRTTLPSTAPITMSNKEGKVYNQAICFSMMVTTCKQCTMDVIVSSSLPSKTYVRSISSSYRKWSKTKITFSNILGKSFRVGIQTKTNSSGSNNFWSIDNFRYCSPTEYRVSSPDLMQDVTNCKLLFETRKVTLGEATNVTDINCGSLNLLGGLCIPCNVLRGNNITKSCKKMKICEGVSPNNQRCFCSPGYTGRDCTKGCGEDRDGYGCQKHCEDCLKNKTCFKEHGTCICHPMFEGTLCELPRYGETNLTEVSSNSCTIQIINGEHFSSNENSYFLVQYQKKGEPWKNYTKLPSTPTVVVIENLEYSSSYLLRILCVRNNKSIEDIEQSDVPSTSCNTNCEPSNYIELTTPPMSSDNYALKVNYVICHLTINLYSNQCPTHLRDLEDTKTWSGDEIDILSTELPVNISLQLSDKNCRLELYKWSIKSINGTYLENGSTQKTFLVRDLPLNTYLEIFFYGPNNISKWFRTPRGSVSEPRSDVQLHWFKNNTLAILWKYPNGIKENIRMYQIFSKINNNSENIDEYEKITGSVRDYGTPCDFQLEVPPSADVNIKVMAVTTITSEPAQKNDSSHPVIPHLVDTEFPSINITTSTITIHINVTLNENEEKHKNHHYLFIIIKDPTTTEKEENVRKLEEFLDETISRKAQSLFSTEFDLNDFTLSVLNFIVGQKTKKSYLLDTYFTNKSLEKAQKYKIFILVMSECKKKFLINTYHIQKSTTGKSRGLSKHGKTSQQWAYYCFLILVPIIFIGLIIFGISQALKKFCLNGPLGITIGNLNRSGSNNEVLILESKEPSPTLINTTGSKKSRPQVLIESAKPPNVDEKIHSNPIKVSSFEEYVKDAIARGELARQHNLFSRGSTQPCFYGSMIENKAKNRYLNLVAYDHSRVKLEKLPGNEYSDYINANFIHGYKVPNAFIATQGPKQSTLEDFWRMIWQENVTNIIALANIFEGGKKKVEKYWPGINEKLSIGDMSIKFVSAEVFSEFEYRIIDITRGNKTRKLEQLHFTSWPDHGVPFYPQSLIPFIRRMLKIRISTNSPVVVHCSAGVGRTGTILLADICLRMAAREGVLDMLNNLQKLREQRSNMVDNVEQYKLAHLVVLECLMGLQTGIPCKILDRAIYDLLNEEEYKLQMEYLLKTQWQDDAMRSVAESDKEFFVYPEKNRFQDISPDDKSRINLSKYPSDDPSSTYINAVKVDGFRCPGRFIVTQQPMPNTIGDFWRLIFEQRASLIVSLNEIDLRDQTCCQFFPTANKHNIRPVDFMSVTLKEIATSKDYDIHSVHVLVNNGKKKKFDVNILTFKNWPSDSDLPSSCEQFMSFWEQADTLSRHSETILVTCYDGRRASGVYVALCFVIEKIKLEQECDVCLAVRTVRRNRKQLVTEEKQFIFLYEAALRFVNGFQSYANFESE